MKKIIESHPLLEQLLSVWNRAQAPMHKVKRWGKHHKRYKRLKRQSTLEHTYSITLLAELLLLLVPGKHRLDGRLIRLAFLIHDFSEGILQRDVILKHKSTLNDLAEYLAFEEVFKPLGGRIWKRLERAYLLQFAHVNPGCFPNHARAIMRKLWEEKHAECLFFAAIERFDYILFPLSHGDTRIAPKLFTEVICGNAKVIDSITRKLPTFRQAIWSRSLSRAARDFGANGKAPHPKKQRRKRN